MAFPSEHKDKPGRFHQTEDGWQCDVCAAEFNGYQQVMGHMGAHPIHGYRSKPTGRKPNVISKDPMSMTLREAVETIEELRAMIEEVREEGREAIVWQSRVKNLFGTSAVEE